MTLKTYTIEKKNPKHKQIWEWQEHEGLIAAIEELQKSTQAVKDAGTPKRLFIPNKNSAPLKKRNDKES